MKPIDAIAGTTRGSGPLYHYQQRGGYGPDFRYLDEKWNVVETIGE